MLARAYGYESLPDIEVMARRTRPTTIDIRSKNHNRVYK